MPNVDLFWFVKNIFLGRIENFVKNLVTTNEKFCQKKSWQQIENFVKQKNRDNKLKNLSKKLWQQIENFVKKIVTTNSKILSKKSWQKLKILSKNCDNKLNICQKIVTTNWTFCQKKIVTTNLKFCQNSKFWSKI